MQCFVRRRAIGNFFLVMIGYVVSAFGQAIFQCYKVEGTFTWGCLLKLPRPVIAACVLYPLPQIIKDIVSYLDRKKDRPEEVQQE